MASSPERGDGRLHRLTVLQIDTKHQNYHKLQDEFEDWLVVTASEKGWKRPRSKSDTVGYVRNLEQLGQFLKEKNVKIPRKEQNSLEQCIKLREQLNEHFENLSPKEVGASKFATRERENEGHRYLIQTLVRLLDDLGVPLEQVHRVEIAQKMRATLMGMQKMTESVMDAWKEYRSTSFTLAQATLVTHAAVEEAQRLEKELFEQLSQNKDHQDLVERFNYGDYDPKLLPLTKEKNEFKTPFDHDLHALLEPERNHGTTEELKRSMDIIHYPTVYVLANFQGMSTWWNTWPVPGYPLCLEHVFYEGKKHRNLSATDPGFECYDRLPSPKDISPAARELRAKQRRWKDEYKHQIEIIWRFLNEIHYLRSYKMEEGQQSGVLGFTQELHGVNEFEDPEWGTRTTVEKVIMSTPDVFSKALNDVIEHPDKVSMSTSFAIQLLLKIYLLFEKDSGGYKEDTVMYFRQEARYEARMASEQRIQSTLLNRHEPMLSRIYASCRSGNNALWAGKANRPQVTNTFKLRITDNYSDSIFALGPDDERLGVDMVGGNRLDSWMQRQDGEKLSMNNSVGAVHRMHRVDPFCLDTWSYNVTWHSAKADFYSNMQPLYAGTFDLARRLADYRADVGCANETLSIFTVAHLKEASSGPQEAQSQIPPSCEVVMRQHQNWIPQSFSSRSAAELLDIIEGRVWESGKTSGSTPQYTIYETNEDAMMKPVGPVDALWRIFALRDPETDFSTFLKGIPDLKSKASGSRKLSRPSRSLRSRGISASATPRTLIVKETTKPVKAKLDVEALADAWRALPCDDAKRELVPTAAVCDHYLLNLGREHDLVQVNGESAKNFHCRLLYALLEKWKTIEEANEKGESSKQVQEESQIRNEVMGQYKEAKVEEEPPVMSKRNKRKEKKRKGKEAVKESLPRSDKRKRLY